MTGHLLNVKSFFTMDTETRSRSQEGSEREGMVGERLQRFLRPHFSVVKTQMQNWDSSSSNEIMSSMFLPTRHSI